MKNKLVFVKHLERNVALGVQMKTQSCSSHHQEAATNYTRVKSEGHCARMGSSRGSAKTQPHSPSSQVKQLSHLCPPPRTSSLTQARLVGTPVPASQPPMPQTLRSVPHILILECCILGASITTSQIL